MINPYELGLPDPETAIATLDLAAQQSMAWWTRAMFWTALISCLLSAGALTGLFLSLAQTRAAVRDSRISSELENQAYAFIDSMKYSSPNPIVAICKNTGNTPVTHFSVSAKAELVENGLISKTPTHMTDGFKTWSRLAPNDETSIAIPIDNPDLVQNYRLHGCEDGRALVISGVLLYCTIYNIDHVSHFIFFADNENRDRFRRPTANIPTFKRIEEPNRDWRKFPSPWRSY